MMSSIETANVHRRACVKLNDRLAPAASADQQGRPADEETVVRIRPAPPRRGRHLDQAPRDCAQLLNLQFSVAHDSADLVVGLHT
jgi:hypothetical protein